MKISKIICKSKKVAFISTLSITFTLGNAAYAGEKIQAAKQATTFSVATLAGLAAGGPIGGFIGALSGVYFGEQSKENYEAKKEMKKMNSEIATLENSINEKNSTIVRLNEARAKNLEFQVIFPTGVDELAEADNKRLSSIAGYLQRNPELKIRLDGHADPRGTDEYNNVLSQERVKSVLDVLSQNGIGRDRVEFFAHGSTYSNAYKGDLEAYARERRVNIEIFAENNDEEYATLNNH